MRITVGIMEGWGKIATAFALRMEAYTGGAAIGPTIQPTAPPARIFILLWKVAVLIMGVVFVPVGLVSLTMEIYAATLIPVIRLTVRRLLILV